MKIFNKRFYAVVWGIIILLGLYVCVRGFSVLVFSGMENPLNSVINEMTNVVGKNVMNLYMPAVKYGIVDKQEDSFTESIINEIVESYPIYKYLDENSGDKTTAESEYTYEMIIAAEAADENYINHQTGEVIHSDGKLMEEENAQYIEQENSVTNEGNSQENNANEESAINIEEIEQKEIDVEESNSEEVVQNIEDKDSEMENNQVKSDENSEDITQNNNEAQASSSSIVIPSTEYSLEKLADFDFLKNTFYSVDSTTSVDNERLNAKKMIEKDMTLQQDSKVPQILIYHTHSQEAFVDSVAGDTSTSIVGVGAYLAEILANSYGYNVIHNTSTYDMINGKLDRNYAFTLAEPDIKRILQENPSIEVVIDMHRDGINENTHLVTDINGKPTAQFMFFNGLSYNSKIGNIEYLYNPYIEENLAFSFQMQLKAAKYYPNLTRKIYLKGYRYNLHLMPRATLIEVGGQTNTVEEAKNAMEPLADILDKVLKGN